MYANNEIGVVQPVREIGAICRERGVFFHCDAAQAFGKIPIDVEADHIDLMSLSAHKLYGPKGIGALYVRRRAPRVALEAQMQGGGHEFGFRSGTLNVPAIVGFGVASAIARREMAEEAARTGALRDRLLAQLEAALDDVVVNGSRTRRLPGNLNVSFPGVEGDTLLLSLPDIALSTGSACSSASAQSSHVLKALGVGPWRERSAVRFGIGRFTTAEEIDYAAARVVESVRRLRSLAPGGA
jgi:cysteine desulfurase